MNLLEVVETLATEIKNNEHVHAMWLEGSYATGKFDEHSDIDVWLDVDDGSFDEVFKFFKQELSKLGRIDEETFGGIYSENPKLAKRSYHLASFPKEQVIELDLQEHSRKFVFSRKHHVLKIFFDKDETIKWSD
ncbi:MAG TPA: nucleotidyltransferase domain-containing protein [Candidatus Saccharimonadales bacterium]|nr:nucleotidyltransferase domain-containing protein [Candidatus Saccharimonadales bacterium]